MTTWNIDPTHSRMGFSVRHLGLAKVRGAFTDVSGTLETDDGLLKGANATMQVASLVTGVADRDNHLRSPDFFDAGTWPTLQFVVTEVSESEVGELALTGDLTIRDVTRSVTLKAEVLGQATDPWGGRRLALEAGGRIDRRDFGLTWNAALEAGGVLVGHDVDLQIEVQAVAAG